jgi:hypothetical protein
MRCRTLVVNGESSELTTDYFFDQGGHEPMSDTPYRVFSAIAFAESTFLILIAPWAKMQSVDDKFPLLRASATISFLVGLGVYCFCMAVSR